MLGGFTQTATTGTHASCVIDPQVFEALVRHACKQIPGSVHMLMDNVPTRRPATDVRARLGVMDMPTGDVGHVGGTDTRPATFEIHVESDGAKNNSATSDNRLSAACAAIMAALEGRTFTYTPHASEPTGAHTLEVVRVGYAGDEAGVFIPASSRVLTAACVITRIAGRSMIDSPS